MVGIRTLGDMMQAIRAFQESRVFLTALELDLFSALGDGACQPTKLLTPLCDKTPDPLDTRYAGGGRA